jgi:hypothetical protein
MKRSGNETRFASLAECELRRDRAAGELRDEIMNLLVVIMHKSGMARQASALLANGQHRH